MRKLLIYLLPVVLLCSCTGGELYSHYQSFADQQWSADSAVVYQFEVQDTTNHYDMVLNLRHHTTYPFQNIWLFTRLYKDSVLLKTDTLDYYLCDQRGRWLGEGFGALRDMPMLYRRNIRFAAAGTYRLEVQHGMRDTLLRGVGDLGLQIADYVEE